MPTITGYYRYTDIWFSWSDCVSAEDREPLKAALAHDALVSPDHPFNQGDERGVKLYMGTLADGERRLLFSSKQVCYIRYWLQAMGLTKQHVPLPYSNCLLTFPGDLQNVTPVFYDKGFDLKNSTKMIDKLNKQLKKSHLPSSLTAKRALFDRVRELWQERVGTWIAMDFEDWERDHQVLTEFGSSITRWDDELELNTRQHVIVSEAEHYRNGTYVLDNRDRFSFGTSQKMPLRELKAQTKKLIDDLADNHGPLFLIFHDFKDDLKRLRTRLGIPLEGAQHYLPVNGGPVPAHGIYILDTQDLFAALEGHKDKRSLQTMCSRLNVLTQFLHNAGNDAHYTMLALKEMTAHEPLDAQRERRWPGQGITVKYPELANSEDEDADDIY